MTLSFTTSRRFIPTHPDGKTVRPTINHYQKQLNLAGIPGVPAPPAASADSRCASSELNGCAFPLFIAPQQQPEQITTWPMTTRLVSRGHSLVAAMSLFPAAPRDRIDVDAGAQRRQWVGAAAVLIVVALVAALLTALRAASVDPMQALRAE